MISTIKAHKPLVGSGGEKALAYSVGDDFIYRADDDGEVTKIDTKNNLVFIKYSDGKTALIDSSPKNARTSDGFFITTQLDVSKLKVGSKFKKDEIIVQDNSFFAEGGVFTPGRLSKVAIAPLDLTFEDSTVISNDLRTDLASYITFAKPVSVTPNTNIEQIKKIGDEIKTSESLMVFEEVFEDDSGSISKMLDRLGDDFAESIGEFAKTTIPSKYSGEIVDIRIYYNREIEEFSESIQKLITDYQKRHQARFKALAQADVERVINLPTIEKIEDTKVNGMEFDGLLVVFYTKTLDEFNIGSKITVSVALKSINSSTFDIGDEPYSEGNPDENIDLVISPLSLASRMVQDTYYLGYCNKGLLGLKEEIRSMIS